VLIFLAIASVYWGRLLTILIVAIAAYVAFRQWTINARQLRLGRIQNGTVFSLKRKVISAAIGILLSILAFVLHWRSHNPSDWRFIPELPGMFVAMFIVGVHSTEVRQLEIVALVSNAVVYSLIAFACYPHFETVLCHNGSTMSRMSIKSFVFAASVLVAAAGLVIIAAGAVFLGRLDDRILEHAVDYYTLARHYGSITSIGALVCLFGCIGLASALPRRRGLYAAGWSAAVGFATMIFGLVLFPIHLASGAVYFDLLAVAFGASLIFLSVAAVRYAWYRTHSS
jgi:hypothetical protein